MANHYFKLWADDEQEAVDLTAKFLVRQVGWTVLEDITNTASDRDITLSSSGEASVINPNDVIIRLRGFSDSLYFYTYETYVNSSTNTGEVSEGTYGRLTFTGAGTIKVVADLERVAIHFTEDGGSRYFGYAGRIDSYYSYWDHAYPNLIKGMINVDYDFYYNSNPFNMWMRANDGSVDHYYPLFIINANTLIRGSYQAARGDARHFFAVPVFNSTGGQEEVAGELRGIYATSNLNYDNDDIVFINNKPYTNFNSFDSQYTWFVGPMSDTELTIPPVAPSIDWDTSL